MGNLIITSPAGTVTFTYPLSAAFHWSSSGKFCLRYPPPHGRDHQNVQIPMAGVDGQGTRQDGFRHQFLGPYICVYAGSEATVASTFLADMVTVNDVQGCTVTDPAGQSFPSCYPLEGFPRPHRGEMQPDGQAMPTESTYWILLTEWAFRQVRLT